jgi:hypothetical protein
MSVSASLSATTPADCHTDTASAACLSYTAPAGCHPDTASTARLADPSVTTISLLLAQIFYVTHAQSTKYFVVKLMGKCRDRTL